MSKTFRFWMTGCVAVVMAAVSADLSHPKPERLLAAVHSKYSADETLRKLESVAQGQGYTVFARVDAGRGGTGFLHSTALVLGSREGITPVRVDETGHAVDAPLSLVIVTLPDGRIEVRFPAAETYPAAGSAADASDQRGLAGLMSLQSVVEQALA
ncbi:hypothetical protein OOT46_18535 [Aquabacterium sp. A7-Y]|uniref:hypothetical protein n=1 Tax=Aquabacterium sp. A7-Y TaxID=1349605 RepID=UPI00223D7A18|nr:hypothetical protein [Aquabacterium sp. A7-Y]MCW7539836.1 hypothetical protein [Aquabacterium sp. A7-Y]